MESKQTPLRRESVPDLRGRTILVVDDSPMNRKLLVHFLHPTKANIITAQDGVEAISMLRKHSPDLVFMDMQMPMMDGYEATRRAKADSTIASIPIISVTAGTMTSEREQCLEAGCDGYLTKPISQQKIFKMIADFHPMSVQTSWAQSPMSPSQKMTEEEASPRVDNQWASRIAQAIEAEYIPQLNELLNKNDSSALRRFGHTMKGLGRQFQLITLALWGEAFEKSAETLGPDALREEAAKFEDVAKEILKEQTTKAEL